MVKVYEAWVYIVVVYGTLSRDTILLVASCKLGAHTLTLIAPRVVDPQLACLEHVPTKLEVTGCWTRIQRM